MDIRTKFRIKVAAWLTLAAGLTPAVAEPFVPLFVGQQWEYRQHNANDMVGWQVRLDFTAQATFGSYDYFYLQSWNYYNSGQTEDVGYVRSTQDVLYGYNPPGSDFIHFQKAPVGTKWTVPDPGDTYNYEVTEVVAIEAVTVPYASFSEAYKYRKYDCVDPNNLALGQSPYWYEWFVPGVGRVKEEDWWSDYPPGISELVSLQMAPIYRFWSPVYLHHFYTISEVEKDYVLNTWPDAWTYEGPVYYACPEGSPPEGTSPVYRFWSETLGGHFYTISETERDYVLATWPDAWTDEGIVYYAYPEGSPPEGTSPVYRFWSDALGGHFYTISEAEKDYVLATWPDVWTYEGIAWYAYE